ncbi:hypothetical protein C8R46DRAFT_1042547 [Mycena filopes]|nr:hypothetical protein C8R46DRAFT_1042547 [Mycena filopes]
MLNGPTRLGQMLLNKVAHRGRITELDFWVELKCNASGSQGFVALGESNVSRDVLKWAVVQASTIMYNLLFLNMFSRYAAVNAYVPNLIDLGQVQPKPTAESLKFFVRGGAPSCRGTDQTQVQRFKCSKTFFAERRAAVEFPRPNINYIPWTGAKFPSPARRIKYSLPSTSDSSATLKIFFRCADSPKFSSLRGQLRTSTQLQLAWIDIPLRGRRIPQSSEFNLRPTVDSFKNFFCCAALMAQVRGIFFAARRWISIKISSTHANGADGFLEIFFAARPSVYLNSSTHHRLIQKISSAARRGRASRMINLWVLAELPPQIPH